MTARKGVNSHFSQNGRGRDQKTAYLLA